MRVLSLLLFVLLPATAWAQPATVDGELALGLLGVDDVNSLRTGTMPDSLRAFLPSGATVVGSLDREDDMSERGGRFVVALARIDASPEAAAEAYAGRTSPGFSAAPGSAPPKEHGFVTTVLPTTDFSYRADSGDAVVTVRFAERAWGGSFVTIHRRPLYGFERRGLSAGEADQQMRQVQQALPPVTAPSGTRLTNTGSGGSSDDHTDRAVLTGNVSLADLATHVGRQLAAAGWTAGGETTTGQTATSLWTRLDGDRPLAALFFARRTGPDRTELRLHVLAADD